MLVIKIGNCQTAEELKESVKDLENYNGPWKTNDNPLINFWKEGMEVINKGYTLGYTQGCNIIASKLEQCVTDSGSSNL